MKRVVIAAGGSGGHIFPAIALGRALKKIQNDTDILFIGSDKEIDKRIFENERVSYKLIFANKFPFKFSWDIVGFFVKMVIDIFRSLSIIFAYRPDVVVGFGGYVSFPVVFAAWILRIPRITHEQNVVPGRANKLGFKLADKIAISFEETKKYLYSEKKKIIFTGNPIRIDMFTEDRSNGIKSFGLDMDKFSLLIIGGSQGASFLNRGCVDSLASLKQDYKSKLQVIHITGVKDYDVVSKRYNQIGIKCVVAPFVDKIEEAYNAADLVITRSGSSVLFELALLRKAMILVPYPFAMSHQLDNAMAFSRANAAIVFEEKDLTGEKFRDTLVDLMLDQDRLKALGLAARTLAVPEAAANLAKVVAGEMK